MTWMDYLRARYGALAPFLAFVAFYLFAFLLWALMPTPAGAHDWYPGWCCNDKDCRPLPAGAVRLTAGGWFIVETGETIPFEKAKPSLDNQFHRCEARNGATRCFFAPGGEA